MKDGIERKNKIVKKEVKYELTIEIPKNYNLEWVHKIISDILEKSNDNVHIIGFYKLSEK